MAEYIKREALIENLNKFAPEQYNALVDMIIRKEPVADVVEVVRCKDCQYKSEWANDGSYPNYNFCKHSGLWHLTDNHFCSYGVRKEGANNGNGCL